VWDFTLLHTKLFEEIYKACAVEMIREYALELQQSYEVSGVVSRSEKWMEMIQW
jgi:hypothetical protein